MKNKITQWTTITLFLILSIVPISSFAQCLSAPKGQSPSTTQTIANCNGAYQTIANNCFNGQYSKMNVNSGSLYSFKSSKTSDFITISDTDGTTVYAFGVGIVNWTATSTTVVRFYTHANASCGADTRKKKRLAYCTSPPCNTPGTITTSSVTNTTAVISWLASSSSPANGYTYEIRTSGAGGSGATGLIGSGNTLAGIITADITGLSLGTSYTPYVRAACASSFSSYVQGSSFTTTGTAPNPVPAYSHIVVVIGENTSASSVFGSSSAPYINALAAVGAKFTNSFALFHPSQPNYIALYSGSNQGVTNDDYITTKYTTANLGKELIDAGKTYITYSEDLPSVGYDGSSSGLYYRKHNPAANWMGTGTNQIPTTTNQPYTAFPLDYNNLPSVSFVVPNQCNDGHDICAPFNNSVLQYDNWIQTHLDAYKQWAVNNNSLLIVTYDEDEFTSTNKIATVFYGANVAPGTYSQTINHYTILRTIEEAFRLTTHAGNAATAVPISYCWSLSPRYASPLKIPVETSLLASDGNMTIFPNPADNKVTILLKSGMELKSIHMEIYAIDGRKLVPSSYSYSIKNNQVELDTNNLKNGIYSIRILDGEKQWINRFVISR